MGTESRRREPVLWQGESPPADYPANSGENPVSLTAIRKSASAKSSMARTTSYTCTAGVHLLASGMFTREGICPQEFIAEEPLCTEFVLDHLAARSVTFQKRVEELDEEGNPVTEAPAEVG